MSIPAYMAADALRRMREEEGRTGAPALLGIPAARQLVGRHGKTGRILKAEPVSTAIGIFAIESLGLASTIGFAGATALGSTILAVGASLALSAASMALQKSTKQSDLNAGGGYSGSGTLSQASRRPQIAALPEQRLVLGTVTSSGVLCWRRYDPPYLWHMYLLAAHECGDFQSLIVNGIDVPLRDPGTGILAPTATPFFDGADIFLELGYRNGDVNQAMDAIVARDFPTMPDTFRQRGHTAAMLKADFGATQAAHENLYGTQNQFNPLFRYAGARYFDPRVPGCDMNDPQTWVEGSSASLCLARALYHPWSDMKLLDVGSINWDMMIEAADIDDRWVARADGTLERNHTVSGIINSGADPLQMSKELLTACDGFLIMRGGKYHVMPGAPRAAEGTLHQDMLAGGFELHTETPDRDLINIAKSECINPDLDYKPVVGPVLRRDDLIVRDGKPLEATYTLPFTEGHQRAQRLLSRKMIEARGSASGATLRRAFSGTFGIEARNVRAGQIRNIEFRDFPKVDGEYLITQSRRDETNTRFQIDGVSWSNDRFAWHAPSQEMPFEVDQDVLDAEAA